MILAKSRQACSKAIELGNSGAEGHVCLGVIDNGTGNVHTAAQISGKAASMGEGVMVTILDALIKDFTGKLAAL